MRSLHRIGSFIAVLVMLYLGVTGTLIQSIDLRTLLRHTPSTDPTMQSIEEGMYGNNPFPVITLRDHTAAELPQNLDYEGSIAIVLQAMHRQNPGVQPRFVELRMASGTTIGQVRLGPATQAFNATTGEPVTAIDVKPPPLPPSTRESIKRLHRFWSRHDTPGVYVELLSGVALWTLLLSGLVMYFRMLSTRTKAGRRQLFWITGSWWRSLHRVVSVVAAVFLLAIAFSGTWLGFESVWHSLKSPMPTLTSSPGVPRAPEDFAAPLTDDEVQQMTSATLALFRQASPQTPIKVLRLRVYGAMKQGVVVTGSDETTQVVFNTETGRRATLSDPLYPESGFPFGTQMHENIKHFHSGQMFGIPARLMNLFAGLSLIFLSISGIVVYVELWLKRRKTGRNVLVWL